MSEKKKRILFVDDELFVLEGLKRMLRGMREQWDMDFVDSGIAALERMGREPFDVVVSDMQMPEMNGAELLNEVMRRYPRTVRLILSGQAERSMILRCVGSTHQYLAKPCDPEVLKYTVARATMLESVFTNPALTALVGRIDTLPSVPALYTEIVTCLQSPTATMLEVGAIIEKDVAMTAKVLKIVNSAFFGLAREVSSAADAASYLGADVLKALVLSAHIFARHEADHGSSAFVETLWGHSIATGTSAKALAKAEGADAGVIGSAFVAGMLHDVGKLVLASNFPKEYRQALARMERARIGAREAELEVFGSSHAEIGGYLLGLWGLPTPVVEAVALHHSPEAALRPDFGALTAVHVANVLVHGNGALDSERIENQGLSGRVAHWQETVSDCLAQAR